MNSAGEMTMTTTGKYAEFMRLCHDIGTDNVSEENAILSVGREFLPPCAIVVLDGGEATEEYWDFLIDETTRAQAEHDAEYDGGHEWHQDQDRGSR